MAIIKHPLPQISTHFVNIIKLQLVMLILFTLRIYHQVILINMSSKTYDVLQPKFAIAVHILLSSEGMKYVRYTCALVPQYPRVYPHTSDQCIY